MFSGQVPPVHSSNATRSWYPCIGLRCRSARRPCLTDIDTEYAYPVCVTQASSENAQSSLAGGARSSARWDNPPMTPWEAAAEIWTGVGGSPTDLAELAITGDERVLPSTFRVGAAAAAA